MLYNATLLLLLERENQDTNPLVSVCCMKPVRSPLPSRIILYIAVALLFLKFLFTINTKHYNLVLSNTPLLSFILFNSIIVAIIVGSHKPSIDEINGSFPYMYDSFDITQEYSDVDDFEDDIHSLDGYQEDEEDDMDDGWSDEEEFDDDLQKRIEDFIAKVNNGWREERLKDKDYEQIWIGNIIEY
ncbi:hypothetical protein COLO4_23851 [Corchorus olitorius]|uniref:Uncharacterized protein n=1 Tax=Corchorus olitorius TaxID=93759 RepID=A0A1R3IEA4_9ROSI|nr:hypothetical protein COLO4_23851 [Corchorus olitorius]